MLNSNLFLMYQMLTIVLGLLFSCIVLLSTNLIYALLSLIVFFIFISLFLFFLGLDAMSFIFIIIYVGAIAVLFIFVVVTLDERNYQVTSKISLVITLLIFIFVFISIYSAYVLSIKFARELPEELYGDRNVIYKAVNHVMLHNIIGKELYSFYGFIFIANGILLFVSMVGVIFMSTSLIPPLTKQKDTKQIYTKYVRKMLYINVRK